MLAIAIAGAGAAFCLGFVYFLSQVHAAGRARPVKADIIVVFSGEPKRIEIGTNLLARRAAPELIIVGQDNRDDISKMRAANKLLFSCCVRIDQRSVNTSEDARLAKHLLKNSSGQSLILVTSAFHMPRARRELAQQVPEKRIIPYGVADDFYRISDIPRSAAVASAFLSQYVLYVSSGIPGSRTLWDEGNARRILPAITNLRNLALILLATVAATIAALALSRHQHRTRGP
jgi:uncharacterized SAM-binding protein YcdF (DUF218 family)